jgi:hypothetical protein
MRHRKSTHPVTADMRRELDIRVLTKAGAFKRPMRFPFQRIEVTARDHVRLYPLTVRETSHARPDPQVIRVTWRRMTFGMKPFFVCSRCNKRRVFLYFDGLQAYCRCCAGAWYWCQRKHHRTRLLRWSHKLRVRLGDQFGKPGDQFPPRPKLQRKTRYRRTIARLRRVEQQYLHIIANDRRYLPRERDELGRYLPNEVSADDASTMDLGT